jgi:predicted nuclease of predicted toxin-antitoxin system
MLRLLVDMKLSVEWIPILRGAGHDAVHWSDIGDPRALDSTLMLWAVAHHRAVITHDLDFGAALALSGAGKPSVVQIRTLNTLPRHLGKILLPLLDRYRQDIEHGALIIADEHRQRVRILPLKCQG